MADRSVDLAVVGGGTAGLVAALAAAEIGARVVLVERARTGGDCLWTGCVPSKALLAAAARGLGFEDAMAHVRATIAAIEPVDSPEALRAAGVRVLTGHARFTSGTSMAVRGRPLPFRRAIIATGAAPVLPCIPGLDEVRPFTSETIWQVPTLPRRLLVVGGGPVGCELSQAFARLGAEVTLVEAGERLLPAQDPDAAALVRTALEADGVTIRPAAQVLSIGAEGGSARHVGKGEALVRDGSGQEWEVAFDAILVAVGRRPRTADLGLPDAGVRRTPTGAIAVSRSLRTTARTIWAAGDVTPFPHLTHLAGHHGGIAAVNALLGVRRAVDMRAVPRVVYTDPEVASVGEPTWHAGAASPARAITRHHEHVDRAIAQGRTDGFSRLALDGRGRRIVGATIVGPRAGESIAEITLAVRQRVRVTEYAATIHAYPTYADGPWNAALDEVRRRLATPPLQRLTRVWVAARRAG